MAETVKNKIGRPRVLTEKVQQEIIRLVRDGNYMSTACQAVGITPQCVYYWRDLCEANDERALIYVDFFESLARAQAIAEIEALRDVRTGKTNTAGAVWFLSRRFPKRWTEAKDRPERVIVERGVISEARDKADERIRSRKSD